MSSIYLIALANISGHRNNISMAKGNLELVVLEKVELNYYVSLFYYQSKIKISHLESDASANAASFLILEMSKKYLLNQMV